MKIKIFSLVLIIVATIVLLLFLKDRELVNEVKNHEYSIKYIIEPSMKGYSRKELFIDSEGNAVSTIYMIDNSVIEISEGRYFQDELDDFIIYSIKQGMTKMSNDMDSKDIMDGSNIYFEIELGDKSYNFGGYMATHVNFKFKKINSKFIEMKKKVATAQQDP